MRAFSELPAAKAALIRDLLRHKRTRDKERAFVLEGAKPIREVLQASPDSVRMIVLTQPFLNKCEPAFRHALQAHRTVVYMGRTRIVDQLADVITSSGILAVVRQPQWDQQSILARPNVCGLYGESLQDPANVGAIVRTAAAFGLDAVWLSGDSVDVFNPKVVRATSGTLLHLPVFTLKAPGLFEEQGCAILAAQPQGKDSCALPTITERPARAILAFGNESRGLSAATLKQAVLQFHIPTARSVESLNVAASVAIAVFYFSELKRVRGEWHGVRGSQD